MIAIKEIRSARGITQAELAERIGTTVATISRYESGQREPTLTIAAKLAAALDCSVDDLVERKEES